VNKRELNFFVCTVRPRIEEFQSVTAQEGAVAELICRAQGDPVPQMRFSQLGDSIALKLGENVSQICGYCCLISQSSQLQFLLQWLLT